jgi:hypothetical protein
MVWYLVPLYGMVWYHTPYHHTGIVLYICTVCSMVWLVVVCPAVSSQCSVKTSDNVLFTMTIK